MYLARSHRVAPFTFHQLISTTATGWWSARRAQVHDAGAVWSRAVQNPMPCAAGRQGTTAFHAKEIHSSPVVGYPRTISNGGDGSRCRRGGFDFRTSSGRRSRLRTAYYAGLVGKYWFERFARLRWRSTSIRVRYRESPSTRHWRSSFRNRERPPTRLATLLMRASRSSTFLGRQRGDPTSRQSDV